MCVAAPLTVCVRLFCLTGSTNLDTATRVANDSSVALAKAKEEAARLVVELQSAEAVGKSALRDASRHEKRARQLENQLKAVDRTHHDTRTELNIHRKEAENTKTHLRSVNASLRTELALCNRAISCRYYVCTVSAWIGL